ncbi:hypothetical protein [Paenibacillus radicis (ex Xue et al. 2023)]|uniref:Uncharacterized protein n=1 Tax=Paenibacillus radicis (ex Xue et al. 2023) TaxID=2972489 RepID=A0ABT1YKF4_9BACL|nr:hypothetical protein [Paenibacillus radicis (ex Xue et al. 2023)]MCR8633667.1 hypothetical protein [Paenibacillus radicis (ex Xue et al. 2023)]
MTRKTANHIGVALYCCLMISIPLMIYLEINNHILLGILMVCIMFGLSMGLLAVSEIADKKTEKVTASKQKLRNES